MTTMASPHAPSVAHTSTVATKFGRALRLKCPRCGGGDVLRSWFRLQERCPRCALLLDRGEPDYWLGAYAINLVVAEGLAAIVGLVVLVRTWPRGVPGTATGVALAILLPIVFFPFSRLLWLAWDLSFRPSEPGD
jgi:uncharacterized protein (DUF983 family)